VLRDPQTYTERRIELASDAPEPAQITAALSDAHGPRVRSVEAPVSAMRHDSADMAAMWATFAAPVMRPTSRHSTTIIPP
jgi:hypothetical protein